MKTKQMEQTKQTPHKGEQVDMPVLTGQQETKRLGLFSLPLEGSSNCSATLEKCAWRSYTRV